MAEVRCQMCGGPGPTHSCPILVPVNDYRGRPIDRNSVHFLCQNCRKAVAHAERAAKRATPPPNRNNETVRCRACDLGFHDDCASTDDCACAQQQHTPTAAMLDVLTRFGQ